MTISQAGMTRMIEGLKRSASFADARPEDLWIRATRLFGIAEQPAPERALTSSTAMATIDKLWDQTSLHFSTSGSTGQPKILRQDMGWLVQEARFHANLLREGRRVVSMVPACHIYGFLFTVLMPDFLNIPVVDLEAPALGALVNILKPGDILVSFPFLWKKFSEIELSYPEGITGVTSTGPCPSEIILRALSNGLSRMVEIHGSTETGGLGYRLDPTSPYRLMDFWLAPPVKGMLHRVHPSGGEPTPFALPDRLEWQTERLYRPVGRKDLAIQIGGVNVYPERVRQVLTGHPLVEDAAVRPMRPEEGDRLKAFIVPARLAPSRRELIRAILEYLSRDVEPPGNAQNFHLWS